ncbi:MAG TPA: 7TM diverse intracellular signaling domain-containing protein [Dongiaceae bacterium]|nr:7TM diverse intracellular signaling domain-containing protein [Dongiaceae bacterium]
MPWLLLASLCLMAGLMAGPGAWASPLAVRADEGHYRLTDALSYAHDRKGDWAIEEVARPDTSVVFTPSKDETLAFGYVDAVYWLRLDLVSQERNRTSWVLEIAGLGRSIDEIDLFLPDDDGHWSQQRSGDSVPFGQRAVQHHAVLFSFQLPSRQLTSVYLRVKTSGTLQIPAILWSAGRYLENEHHDSLVEGIFYGVLLIMIFYNGFIYLSIRDPSYVLYVCYLACVLGFAISLKGVGFEYLWPEQMWWNNKSNLVFAELGVLFVLLFARSFLNTPKNTRLINYVIALLILTSIACFPVVVVAKHYVAASVLSVQYVFAVASVVIAASLCLQRGFKAARYYLLAWLGVLVSILVWVLNSFNVIHSWWLGAYVFQIGTTIQVLLFSFALADRINLLRAERESALNLQLAHSRRLVSMAQMFEKFVPKQFLRRIAREGIENIQLGKAEHDEISVLFADIRGFTSLSETLTPQELLNFLNACFARLDKVIHQHNGFIDKFLGDGVMALFEHEHGYDPISRSALDAVRAAIEMHEAVKVYNQHRARSGYVPIDIGIGINSGPVVIGTVGSSERMDSTVLGDNVNVAARLQELTKQFGARIIISEHTQAAVFTDPSFELRELGEVTVRGRKEPVRLYEVLNADDPGLRAAKQATLPTHLEALDYYRQGDLARAAILWDRCLSYAPDDSVCRHLRSLCV